MDRSDVFAQHADEDQLHSRQKKYRDDDRCRTTGREMWQKYITDNRGQREKDAYCSQCEPDKSAETHRRIGKRKYSIQRLVDKPGNIVLGQSPFAGPPRIGHTQAAKSAGRNDPPQIRIVVVAHTHSLHYRAINELKLPMLRRNLEDRGSIQDPVKDPATG